MSMKGTCCCCFINNARSLILLLSFFCIISLFANTLLLNFAVIHKDELIPKHFLPLSQKTYGLPASETPRLRRHVNESEIDLTEGVPVPMEDQDDTSTQALISQLENEDKINKLKKKKPQMDVDEGAILFLVFKINTKVLGYPIPSVDSSLETAFEAATYPPTTRNTRLVLLTKATIAGENENENENNTEIINEEIKEVGFAPLIGTTHPPKFASKGFLIKDKDNVDAIKDGEEKTKNDAAEIELTDYSGVSFFDRSLIGELFDCLFFAAPGIGMLLSYIPSSFLIRKLGCHKVILIALLISSIATVAIPFLLVYGINAIIGARVFQGIAFGPIFCFIGKNAVAWGSLKEQLWFICTCVSALIITPIISWSFSNEILNNKEDNFSLIFYLHAIFSFILAIIWLIFYRDTPQKHRWVNGLELNKVMSGKAQNNRIMEHNVTSTIFTSVAVISIWIAAFGYFCAFALFATFLPIYANTVTHLIPYQAGAFAIIPFALMAFVHWVSYLFNKCFNLCGLTLKVRLYNSFAFVICAFFFLGLAIAAALHRYNEYSSFVSFVHFAALFSLGFAINGFFQSSIVVGRYYSQYIIGHMMLPFSLAYIFVPTITIFFTPLNLLRYWRLVFLVIVVVLLISAVVFAIFGQGQPSIWAEESWDPTSTQHMISRNTLERNAQAECGIISFRTVDDYLQSSSDL